MPPIASIILIAGLALIVVGLVGGGIEAKEIKIPRLPVLPRAASFLVGCALIGLVLFYPKLFESPGTKPTAEKPFLGAAIPRLTSVSQVKIVLRQLNIYRGAINDEPDDAYFQAVAAFQRSKNITQDGLVGAETYAKLRDAWPEFFGDKEGKAVPQGSKEGK